MNLSDIFKRIRVNNEYDERLQVRILEDFLQKNGHLTEFAHFAEEWAKSHPESVYNAEMEDDLCECGHPYYRHFDTYEDMRHIGCKYCACYDFKKKL